MTNEVTSETNTEMTKDEVTNETGTAEALETDPNSTEAWEMALSCVAALEQTRKKAIEEHRAAVKAAGGRPFGRGIPAAQHLVEALNEALRTFKPDLNAIARANRRALPKEVY